MGSRTCVRGTLFCFESEGGFEDAFGGEREHEAGESAEDHAEADEGADDPNGARWPGSPDHDGEDEGDDAVDREPPCAMAGTELEELDELNDSFEEEVAGENKGEGEECRDRVKDQVEAGDQIDSTDQDLPDEAAGGVGFEGKDEVSDGADDHQPAEDESNGYAGDRGDADGDEAGDDQKDAEGDGPVDGFGG
jgi:hypothetical protein